MKLKKIIKRVAAFASATGIVLISVMGAGSFTSFAVETTGYWMLKETNINLGEDEFEDDGYPYCVHSASELSHSHTTSYRKTAYHGAGSASFIVNCSAPPARIEPGDRVEMHLDMSMQKSGDYLLWGDSGRVSYGEVNDERNGLKYNVGARFLPVDENGSDMVYLDTMGNPPNCSATDVYYVIDDKGRPGSEMTIVFIASDSLTVWIYEWIDTTPAEVPEEVTEPEPEKPDPLKDETVEPETAPVEVPPVEEVEEDKKVDIVVNSEAKEEEGSQDAGGIPSGIVNGWKKLKDMIGVLGGGAAAVVGTALSLAGLSDNESDGEEEQKTYRMVVYKEFGDTINRGEEVIVYACIMENDPRSGERVNHKLTSQISIFSEDDTFDVREQSALAGDYKGARVKTSDEKGSYTMEGIISFRFTGKGGTFTNRMKFKIAGADIFFGQENIGLPHDLNESMKPWFIVTGMANKPEITAEITPEGVYNVNVTEAESTGISGAWAYYANIIPITGAPTMEDREPGAIEVYKLHVTAEGAEKQSVEAALDVVRIRTGLTLTTKHVDCFWNKTTEMKVINEKDGGDGTKWFKTECVDPVMTEAEIKLIIFDLEEHKVKVVAPIPLMEKIRFYSDDKDEQNLIDRLEIVIDPGEERPEFGPEGGLKVRLFTKRQLDAPRRIMAKVSITAEAFGKSYTTEQDIQLCSQPNRSGMDFEEFSRAVKEDEKVGERLMHLRNYIQNTCYDKLFPLHRMLTDLIDSYDPEYGYDKEQVGFIYNCFNRYCRGYLLGANAKPYESETLSNYAYWVICSCGDAMDRFEGKFSFIERLLLGIFTGGQSEVVFTTFDILRVPYRMTQALERGKSDITFFGKSILKVDSDSILGLTIAGAHDLIMGEVQGMIFGKVLHEGWDAGKMLSKRLRMDKVFTVMTQTEKALNNYNKKLQNYRANNDIFKGTKGTFNGVFKSNYKPNIDAQSVKAKAAQARIGEESIRTKTDKLIREFRQTDTGKAATEHGVYVKEMPDGSQKVVGLDLSDPYVAKRQKSLRTIDDYKRAVRQEQQAVTPEAKAEAAATREKLEFEIMADPTTHDLLNAMNGMYALDYKYTYAQHAKAFKAKANAYACEYTVKDLKKTNPKIKDSDIYMKNLTTNKDNPYKDGKDLDQTQMMIQGEGLPDVEVTDTLQYRNNVKGVYKAKTGMELSDANFKEGERLYKELQCETVAGEGQFAGEKFSDVDGVLNPEAASRPIKNAAQNAEVMARKTQIFIDQANAATDPATKGGCLRQALYATNKGVKRTIVMRNDAHVDMGKKDVLTETDKIRIDAIERTVDMKAPEGHLNMDERDCWGVLKMTGIRCLDDLSRWIADLTMRVSGGV